jgi:hypothetical protein
MFRTLPITIALMTFPLCLGPADAIPLATHGLSPPSNVQLVRVVVRGPHGGAAVRGPRGGVAVRGPHGGVAVRGGAHRIGGRYYGGVWYGHVRRWYGGRWWPYGVGSCWTSSPIGYVWTCG